MWSLSWDGPVHGSAWWCVALQVLPGHGQGMTHLEQNDCDDPGTALWRVLPDLKRSTLAKAYREQLDGDWRDYYEGPYTDDGPSVHEDCDYCFGTRGEHWEDCIDPLRVGVER